VTGSATATNSSRVDHVSGAAQASSGLHRSLRRRQEVIDLLWVGIEACASAHHWSREPQALGHKVRLTPPAYVKPYAKRQKNDAADAEAICQAVTRANMRFVPTKTPEQQSGPVLHRARHLFIRQRPRRSMQSGPSCRFRDRCTGRAPRCRGIPQSHSRSERYAPPLPYRDFRTVIDAILRDPAQADKKAPPRFAISGDPE
jgi:hypothetical protein